MSQKRSQIFVDAYLALSSQPWQPDCLNAGFYADVKQAFKDLCKANNILYTYQEAALAVETLVGSRKAAQIANQAISDMIFGDTHKT